jgi:hypothetical protein
MWDEFFVGSSVADGKPLQYYYRLAGNKFKYLHNDHLDKRTADAGKMQWRRRRQKFFVAVAFEVGGGEEGEGREGGRDGYE